MYELSNCQDVNCQLSIMPILFSDYFCPPIPSYNMTSYNTSNEGRTFNTVVSYFCDYGYRPVVGSSMNLTCISAMRRWEPSPGGTFPQCERKWFATVSQSTR